jgi:hypothetical protein
MITIRCGSKEQILVLTFTAFLSISEQPVPHICPAAPVSALYQSAIWGSAITHHDQLRSRKLMITKSVRLHTL